MKIGNFTLNRANKAHIIILMLIFVILIPLESIQFNMVMGGNKFLTIRVGTYENYPKIYTDEQGEQKGIFPEILDYIAEKESWVLEYIPGNWSQCLERLENNEIDLMVDVAYTEEREEKYDFTNETIFNNWGTIYSKKNLEINSILDLEGKKIAVMTESVHTEGKKGIKNLLEQFTINATFIEVTNYTQVFELIDNQEVDAGVVNRLFGAIFSENYRIEETNIIFNPVELRFALTKHATINQDLIENIDYHLKILKQEKGSVYYQILNYYLGSGPVGQDFIPKWMELLLQFSVLLMFLFLSITIVSRVQIQKKTKELRKLHASLEDRVQRRTADLGRSNRLIIKERDRAQQYLDIAAFMFLILDSKGVITLINKKGCKILDYQTEELVGKNWFDLCVPKRLHEQLRENYTKLITGDIQISQNYEQPVLTKSGKEIILSWYITLLKDDSDNFTATLYSAEDITFRKLIEEEMINDKAKIEVNIEKMQDGVLIIEINGDIYLSNQKFREYYQSFCNQKIPSNIREFQTKESDFAKIISDFFYKKREGSMQIEPKEGLHLQIESNFVISAAKKLINVSIIIRDISFLINFNRIRQQFVSNVSHELRTPITVVRQSISNILNYKDKLTQDQIDVLYKIIDINSILMTELIEDLLLVSRIVEKSIKIDWNVYDVFTAVNDAVMQIEPKQKAKEVNIEIDGVKGISIFGDIKRITQVFRIFIDNAVKFSDKKSKIIIKIIDNYTGKFNRENEEGVLIQFIDFGIGIKEKDKNKIFDRFYRSEDVHSFAGTGLGLSIAKDLVSYHEGRVYVESKFNLGSTFSVFLPRLKEK